MLQALAPKENLIVRKIYESYINPYLSFFSIYQDWMMFAPNPLRREGLLKAEVEFLGSETIHFDFPDPAKLSYFEKYLYGEKYRKLINDTVLRPNNHWPKSDIVKFVLRRIKSESYFKIPSRVHLLTRERIIEPKAKIFLKRDQPLPDGEWVRIHTQEVL
jgi:hypothetical protein